MRIVLMVHQFFPEFGAGTESLTYSTARELRRRGHSVEIWTAIPDAAPLAEGGQFDHYEYDGFPIWRFRHSYASPSGGANSAEAEYDNPLVHTRFASFLTEVQPDLVHFFHFARLSASPVRACVDIGIPTAFTPTDFWFMCPTSRLRLPDGSLCRGPDRQGLNCVRHIVERTQSHRVKDLVRQMPDWLVRGAIWLSQQGWWPEGHYSPLLRGLARRPSRVIRLMNSVDRILPPSRLMRDSMVEFGIRPSKLKRIPYGIDLAAAMPTFAKTVSARLRLGFIGTLTRHKGAHVLLQAIRQLPPEAPINALVYGDLKAFPEYGNHLRELAGEDLRIQFRGEFPRDQIGTVLAEIDVLVVPSIWNENTPLVVYSAQASGTPVVASNVAGLNEIIEDGKNGLLFEMGNPEELAGVISRLEGNRSLIRRLARESVKPKSISQYVDDLQVVYAEILAERKTMP